MNRNLLVKGIQSNFPGNESIFEFMKEWMLNHVADHKIFMHKRAWHAWVHPEAIVDVIKLIKHFR
jgi:hypothetical protein